MEWYQYNSVLKAKDEDLEQAIGFCESVFNFIENVKDKSKSINSYNYKLVDDKLGELYRFSRSFPFPMLSFSLCVIGDTLYMLHKSKQVDLDWDVLQHLIAILMENLKLMKKENKDRMLFDSFDFKQEKNKDYQYYFVVSVPFSKYFYYLYLALCFSYDSKRLPKNKDIAWAPIKIGKKLLAIYCINLGTTEQPSLKTGIGINITSGDNKVLSEDEWDEIRHMLYLTSK